MFFVFVVRESYSFDLLDSLAVWDLPAPLDAYYLTGCRIWRLGFGV